MILTFLLQKMEEEKLTRLVYKIRVLQNFKLMRYKVLTDQWKNPSSSIYKKKSEEVHALIT